MWIKHPVTQALMEAIRILSLDAISDLVEAKLETERLGEIGKRQGIVMTCKEIIELEIFNNLEALEDNE